MSMDIEQIKEYLPHRYPFLFVDRVESYEAGKSIIALKNITMGELVFQGHFPDKAVFPGVLIVEAMAQAAGILTYLTIRAKPKTTEDLYYFAGIDKARFKKPVVPGDQLIIEIEIIQERKNYSVVRCKGTARVADAIVCTGELLIAKKS